MPDDKIKQAIYLGVRDAMSFHLASQNLQDDAKSAARDDTDTHDFWRNDVKRLMNKIDRLSKEYNEASRWAGYMGTGGMIKMGEALKTAEQERDDARRICEIRARERNVYSKAIREAPHTMSCRIHSVNKADGVIPSRCNCWKREAFSASQKGN